jgi:hypothetical protein
VRIGQGFTFFEANLLQQVGFFYFRVMISRVAHAVKLCDPQPCVSRWGRCVASRYEEEVFCRGIVRAASFEFGNGKGYEGRGVVSQGKGHCSRHHTDVCAQVVSTASFV